MNQLNSKLGGLEKSRRDLIAYVRSADKNALTFKINDNKWSTTQICFHVIKSEQLTILTLNKNLQLKDKLRESSFISAIRDISLSLVLKSRIKIKVPAIVANSPENYDFDELMKKWDSIRSSLKNYLDNFPEDYLQKEIYKHPLAGWLNLSHTLNFLQNHFDHHRVQIIRLMEAYKTSN